MKTSTVCITDKTGKKFWNTLCSSDFTAPEVRNMQRHIVAALQNPEQYKFLDLPSAIILVDGEEYVEMTDENILAELERE